MSLKHVTFVLAGLIATLTGLRSEPATGSRAHIRGSTEVALKRLEDAEKKLAQGNTADAVEDLQRILDEAADELITSDSVHFVPARRHAHARLASLPDPALASYRDRIDGPARRLLDDAKKTRDPAPLWQLLDRYFVSRPAEEALQLLGDILFERGEIRTAEVVWKRLVPASKPDIAYPSSGDPASAEARLVLAAIFQGELERAKSLLARFKSNHPNASGWLAGVKGPYAVVLESLVAKPPTFPRDPRLPMAWQSIAGSPTREGRINGVLPRHWPSRPTWTAPLPPHRPIVKDERTLGQAPAFDLAIVNGQVCVGDGTQVFTLDRRTGERHSLMLELDGAAEKLPSGSQRFFVRGQSTNLRGGPETSLFSLAVNRGDAPPSKLWSVKPPTSEGGAMCEFLGPPLAVDRRLLAVIGRTEGGRAIHGVACYEPLESDAAPERPVWVCELCDSSSLAPGAEELRKNVPTLAGRHLVICTHTGVVMAVEASTGRRSWAYRYPRVTGAKEITNPPDPSPPVYHAGRVYVAPADSDRVFALDAETGECLWESGTCEAAQLLGVTRGRLIVSVSGRMGGIRGLGILTGSHHEPEGWVQHRPGVPTAFGSGLATDDAIFWPTKSGLFVLHPESGEPLAPPLRPYREAQDGHLPAAAFGPIAFADGCLVAIVPTVVNGLRRDHVWGYVLEATERR